MKQLDGKFLFEENGSLKLVYIWQALKLKEKDIFKFRKYKFYSTEPDENQRNELIPVVNGFYRYKSSDGGNPDSGDGMSISHVVAIQVLSELRSINFIHGKTSYELDFNEIRRDNLKIQFESRRYYYPDLIGKLTNQCSIKEKWGDYVAIEVKVHHGCEPEKLKDFSDHSIPIIEVNITDKLRLREEKEKKHINCESVERYYNHLHQLFREKVYCKVLVDPTTPEYQRQLHRLLIEKNERLEESIEKERYESNLLSEIISERIADMTRCEEEITLIKGKIQILLREISEKNIELADYKNSSVLEKIWRHMIEKRNSKPE